MNQSRNKGADISIISNSIRRAYMDSMFNGKGDLQNTISSLLDELEKGYESIPAVMILITKRLIQFNITFAVANDYQSFNIIINGERTNLFIGFIGDELEIFAA